MSESDDVLSFFAGPSPDSGCKMASLNIKVTSIVATELIAILPLLVLLTLILLIAGRTRARTRTRARANGTRTKDIGRSVGGPRS